MKNSSEKLKNNTKVKVISKANLDQLKGGTKVKKHDPEAD